MVSRIGVLFCFCFAAVMSAGPVWAQTSGGDEFRGRLFVHFEAQAMTAKESFDAVTGSSRVQGFGAGLEAQNLWRSLFVRGAISRLSKTGERVFVFENEVFPLGIPIDVTLTPIEVAAGWRLKPLTSRAIVPYLGAGVLILKYREHTDPDPSDEDVNETYKGVAIFGGIEVPLWRKLSAGAEAGWRSANVKQPGGAMAAFGEKNLGGVTFRVMLSFRN